MSGKVLLNSSGKRVLATGGKQMLSNDAGDGCCCGDGGGGGGGCTPECLVDPDPLCCGADGTPSQYIVTIISATPSPKCSFNTVSPFGVEKLDLSGLAGTTAVILLTDGCIYQSEQIDVSTKVRILRCTGNGSGCAACTPATDVTTQTLMQVTMPAGGSPSFVFTICKSTSEPDNYGPCPGFTIVTPDPTKDFDATCCEPFTISGPGPDGGESYLSIFITSGSVVPC